MGEESGASAPNGGLTVPEGSRKLFLYILFATGMAFFNRAMPTPFLPLVLTQEFAMPMAEVGLVLAAYPLGALAATSWACRVARGTQNILRLHSLAILIMAGAATLFPCVVFLISTGLLPSNTTVVAIAVAAVRAVQGISQALYLAANTSVITRTFHEAVPYVVGMAEVAVGLGAQIGRLSGGPLYDVGGLPCPFLVTAALQVVCGCAGFFFESSEEDSRPKAAAAGPAQAEATDVPVSRLLKVRVIGAFMAVSMSYFMNGLYDATLPQHLEDYLGPLSVSAVSLVTSSRSLAYLVCSYVVAQLLQRDLVSLEMLVVVGFGNVTLGLLTAAPQAFLPELIPSLFLLPAGRWAVMLMSITASSTGNAMLFVPSLPLMQQEVHHLGRHAEEQVAMLFMAGMSAGEATGPILGGWMSGAWGFSVTTGIFAVTTFGMLAFVLFIFGPKSLLDHHAVRTGAPNEGLESPLLTRNSPSTTRTRGPARAFCMASDVESAYAYRRLPFVLGEAATTMPSSAPSATFRRSYGERVAATKMIASVPATSWRRQFKGPRGQAVAVDAGTRELLTKELRLSQQKVQVRP